MEHVKNLNSVPAEIQRVLKPGGMVVNIFSNKGVRREGHCGILRWFSKGSRPGIYYASAYSLGLGCHTVNKSIIRWSQDFCEWLDKWTYYRMRQKIDSTYEKYFYNLRRSIASLCSLPPLMRNVSQSWPLLLKLPDLSWLTPFLTALMFCSGLGLAPAQAQAAYVATELSTLPEESVSVVRKMNDGGEVVGGARINGRQRGILVKDRDRQNLDGLPSSDYSVAFGINDSGEVVGSSNTNTGVRAFRSQRTTGIVNLGTLSGDSSSVAMAINQKGDAVGYSSGKAGVRAVVWTRPGGIKALPNLPISISSRGLAMNDRGDVVGVSEIPPGPRAVLWERGDVLDLGALPGDRASEALDINSKGEIVGSSGDPNEQTLAVLWSPGGDTILELGTLQGGTSSRALGISNDGAVVGTSHSSAGYHAFLWTPVNGMQDLNNLLTLRSGFVLTQAVSINAKGQILAIGMDEVAEGEKHEHDLQTRIFRLVPAP
jgi:probable HAF family extracellular repeat protein